MKVPLSLVCIIASLRALFTSTLQSDLFAVKTTTTRAMAAIYSELVRIFVAYFRAPLTKHEQNLNF